MAVEWGGDQDNPLARATPRTQQQQGIHG